MGPGGASGPREPLDFGGRQTVAAEPVAPCQGRENDWMPGSAPEGVRSRARRPSATQ